MISYVADRQVGEPKVFVIDNRTEPPIRRDLSPEASLKIRNHSPDGFEWGYGGSGPSQLALAILHDYFLNVLDLPDPGNRALLNYQNFKEHFIASALKDGFIITTRDIDCFIIVQDWARLAKAQGLSFQPKEEYEKLRSRSK